MIPPKAIKNFTKDAHREIVVGHLLAYGFYPRTTEGIDQAKKFVDGLDQWVAPSDLPNYYNDIESDLMTGRETAGIVNIRMILEDFYFGGGGGQEQPEDIPVDVEVVEVEQTQPDEPVLIQIEAPFESQEGQKFKAPKRVRLPRRKNTFRKKSKTDKRTHAKRMADAFDRNLLGELIDSIQNPPPPIPSKKRKKKQVQAQKKTSVTPSAFKPGKYKGSNAWKRSTLEGFVGAKLGAAFKNAAIARKEFIDMGGNPEELKNRGLKDSFFAKSLGFEFGGDKIARTRGFFSKDPDASMDPALSRGERFRSGISPLMSSTLPSKQPEEPAPAGSGLGDIGIGDSISNINKTFADIMDGFSMAAPNFDSSIEKETVAASTTEQIESKILEIEKLLGKKVRTQKKIIEVKQTYADVASEAVEDQEISDKEKQLEQQKDTAGFRKYLRAEGGLPDLFGLIKRIIGGDKKDKDGDDPGGGGGGNILGDILGFGLEIAGEELAERGLKKLFERGGQKAVQQAGQQVAQEGAKMGAKAVGTVAAIVGGAGLAASAAGEGLFQVAGKEGGIADKVIESQKEAAQARREAGDEVGATLLELNAKKDEIGSEVLKGTGVALDAIGAPFRYAIEAIRYPFLNEKDREKQAENLAKFDGRIREYTRSWMNRIDFLNIIPDEQGGFGNIYGNEEANKAMMKDMAGYKEKDIDLFRKAREQWIAKREKDGLSKPTPEEEKEFRLNWQKENKKDVSLGDKDTKKLSEGGYNPPKFTPLATGERIGGNLGGTTVISTSTNAMVGEAGDEAVGTPEELSSLVDMVDTGYSNLDLGVSKILGVANNVVKQAGSIAASTRPYYRQWIEPLEKAFGSDNFAFPIDVAKGAGELNKSLPNIIGMGFSGMGSILDKLSEMMGGGNNTTSSRGYQGARLSGPAARLIGNDTEFLAEVTRVCRKFGIKEGDLLALMASESGFNPAEDNGTNVGLIQFSADSARAVGTTQAALKQMTRAQQMKYVEKYFDYWKNLGKMPDNPTAAQLYAVVFAPAYANQKPNEALYSAGSAEYRENRALDTNNDGKITMLEMEKRIEQKKQEFGITDIATPMSPQPERVMPPPDDNQRVSYNMPSASGSGIVYNMPGFTGDYTLTEPMTNQNGDGSTAIIFIQPIERSTPPQKPQPKTQAADGDSSQPPKKKSLKDIFGAATEAI